MEHNLYVYNDYDKNFLKIIDSNLENKIYLLDIETPTMSGIDVARMIRKNDYCSVIIFFSVYDDLSRVIARKNIMALNFINKFDNLESNLKTSLDLALSVVGKKRRIRLESKGIIYNIDLNSILYITKDTVSRMSTIVCDNVTYRINKTMKEIKRELNNDYIQIHKSCIVNKNRIKELDHKKMIITFDNNQTTNLVSKKYLDKGVI